MVDDPKRTISEGLSHVHKLVAFSQDERKIQALRERLSQETPASLSSSWSDNLEILRPGAGKGTALSDLMKSLGIKKAQAMAFGDNLNDMQMMRSVGFPVAMENAVSELKAVARHIAPHHDASGVAKTLRTLVLGGDKA